MPDDVKWIHITTNMFNDEKIRIIESMHCNKFMGEMDGNGVVGISHSICPRCWEFKFPGYPYPVESTTKSSNKGGAIGKTESNSLTI